MTNIIQYALTINPCNIYIQNYKKKYKLYLSIIFVQTLSYLVVVHINEFIYILLLCVELYLQQ